MISNDKFSELTKNDYMIICGDFGGVWDYKKETLHEQKYLNKLNKMPFTTLFVDGNHENFNRLYKYPIMMWKGGKVHKIRNSIFNLMRGEIFEIEGKKIFAFGGASSHDIKNGILEIDDKITIREFEEKHYQFRIRNFDWWDLELPSLEEYDNGLKKLEKYNYKVDYVISHCAPPRIQRRINKYYVEDKLTEYFDNLLDKLSFKTWYFGHYHQNNFLDTKFICLYDDIVEGK